MPLSTLLVDRSPPIVQNARYMSRAPLDIDKEQVRMLVLDIGVREAAKRLGISENTVLSWSRRGKWLEFLRQPPKPPASMRPKPIALKAIHRAKCTILGENEQTQALSPAEILQDELQAHSTRSRLALARAATRSLERVADNGIEIETASDMLSAAKAASLAHAWERSDKDAPCVNVNVLTNFQVPDM